MEERNPTVYSEEYRGYKIDCDCKDCSAHTGRFITVRIYKVTNVINETIVESKKLLPNGAGIMNWVQGEVATSKKYIDRLIDGGLESN